MQTDQTEAPELGSEPAEQEPCPLCGQPGRRRPSPKPPARMAMRGLLALVEHARPPAAG